MICVPFSHTHGHVYDCIFNKKKDRKKLTPSGKTYGQAHDEREAYKKRFKQKYPHIELKFIWRYMAFMKILKNNFLIGFSTLEFDSKCLFTRCQFENEIKLSKEYQDFERTFIPLDPLERLQLKSANKSALNEASKAKKPE